MSREALKTLFYPYASKTLDAPGEGERVLFLGAEGGFALPDSFGAEIVAVQGMRPLFRHLQTAGIEALPQVEGDGYDSALILCGKHRGENEHYIAEAMNRVKADGWIVLAGGKEDGIQSLRKRLEGLGVPVESMPKYHGLAVWFRNNSADLGHIAVQFTKQAVVVDQRFTAAPGMFSHGKVDPGSELLASRLPTDFDGNAADFGAGWGYLSVLLAEKAPRTARIDLFEASYEALEFAKANLAKNCPKLTARFFWQDLISEPPKEKYDLIVMNPPFHEGQAAEPSLGQAMIQTAATALRSGGKLLLVANRGLPYEQILTGAFRESGEVCRNARFKVLSARK